MEEKSLEKRVVRKFMEWTFTLSVGEFVSMLNISKREPDIYMYNPVARTTSRPKLGWIRWPVVFLLSCFHRKHVFADRKIAPMSELGTAIRCMMDRFRWSMALKDNEEDKRWSFLRSKKRLVKPCWFALDEQLETILRGYGEKLFSLGLKARASLIRQRKEIPYIITYAIKLLKNSCVAPIPTDKDAGYALVHKTMLPKIYQETMRRPEYAARTWHSLLAQEILEEFVDIVQEKVSSQDSGLAQALLKDTGACVAMASDVKVFSRLMITVKSHKPPGSVSVRPIHSSVGTPLSPAMKWISAMLRPYLRSRKHLAMDSFEVVSWLKSRTFSKDIKIVRFDIEEFFLSGNHSLLVSLCAEVVEEEYKDAFIKICSFVLRSQYVTHPFEKTMVWKVKSGSGMGLSCSPDIANTAFDRLTESKLLRENHAAYEGYRRYMDDGLILCSSVRTIRMAFLEKFREMGDCFRVKIESMSEYYCEFLDLTIWKGPQFRRSGHLDFCIYRKPTSLAQPLRPSSFHPPGVHAGWPRGLLARAEKLSSSRKLAEKEKQFLLRTFRVYGITISRPKRSQKTASGPVKRLVLPYNSTWSNVRWNTTLRELSTAIAIHTNQTIDFGVSWCLGYRHLVERCRQWSLLDEDPNRSVFA